MRAICIMYWKPNCANVNTVLLVYSSTPTEHTGWVLCTSNTSNSLVHWHSSWTMTTVQCVWIPGFGGQRAHPSQALGGGPWVWDAHSQLWLAVWDSPSLPVQSQSSPPTNITSQLHSRYTWPHWWTSPTERPPCPERVHCCCVLRATTTWAHSPEPSTLHLMHIMACFYDPCGRGDSWKNAFPKKLYSVLVQQNMTYGSAPRERTLSSKHINAYKYM